MKLIVKGPLMLFASICVLALLACAAFRLLPHDVRGHRLLNAARDGSIPRAQLLLILGSPIDYASGSGTALHIAAARGDTAFMEFLLRRGAQPDIQVKWDITPLYYARSYKHSDAERILLAHGANPDTSRINPP
jgi:ankyrin repeat protein